jgi:hypothetical protein
MERQSKRLFILCIILIVSLIGSNAAWIIYENQYVDSVSETIEATSDSGDAYGTIVTGNESEVNYGIKGESNEN